MKIRHLTFLTLIFLFFTQIAFAQGDKKKKKKRKRKNKKETALHVASDNLAKYRPVYQYAEEKYDGETVEVTSGLLEDSTVVFRYHVTRRLNMILDAVRKSNDVRILKDIIGYRIQVYNGRNRQDAERARGVSLRMFPDLKAHPVYKAPTYRVKVGDFEKKEEAYPIYRTLKKKFHHAIIVPDMVKVIRVANEDELLELKMKEAERKRKKKYGDKKK